MNIKTDDEGGPTRYAQAVQQLTVIGLEPPDGDRLLSAACSLSPGEMRARLEEWAAVRDRSTSIRDVPGGVMLSLAAIEPVAALADLVERESACCGFYSFSLTLAGSARELTVSAGPGREVAVQALLGLSDVQPG